MGLWGCGFQRPLIDGMVGKITDRWYGPSDPNVPYVPFLFHGKVHFTNRVVFITVSTRYTLTNPTSCKIKIFVIEMKEQRIY